MNLKQLLVVGIVVSLLVPGVAVAVVRGSPELSVTAADDTVTAGADTDLRLTVLNEGDLDVGSARNPALNDEVTTARGLTVTVEPGSAPIEVEAGTQSVGQLPQGTTVPVTVPITVDEDAAPGTYDVEVTVEYSYTSQISEDNGGRTQAARERTFDVSLSVEEQARFEVVNVSSNVRVADTGTVAVTMENTGTEAATDTSVALTSQNTDLTVGGAGTGSRYVGAWDPGETQTVEYRVTATPAADPQEYAFSAQATFEDDRGRTLDSRALSLGVTPLPDQDFTVVNVSDDLRVGDTGTVAVTLENEGPVAVSDASVTLQSSSADISFGGAGSASRFVGAWAPGETRTVTYDVTARQAADTRNYTLSGTVEYEDPEGDETTTGGLSLGVTPGPEQRFRVVDTESNVSIDDTGTVLVTIRNDRATAVTDARVTLRSENPALSVGGGSAGGSSGGAQSGSRSGGDGGSATTRYVGAWGPGETRTVAFDVGATGEADTRSYALSATVAFEDDRGDESSSRALSLGVTPLPEQSFALSDVSSTLSVGEEGTLEATLTNTGATTARDVVLELTTENPNVSPVETEYSVGTLEPGASETASFEVEISESASAGPRQFSFVTEYRTGDGETRTGDDLVAQVDVGSGGDAFAVRPVNASVGAGSSGAVTYEVTNTGNETVSSVSAKLFADDPISAEDDEAFIERLEPGESTEITFEVSAGGAIEKSYPVSMDFQYDDADGDTLVSDTYRSAVEVTARQGGSGGGLPIPLVVGAVVVVLVVGGYVAYTRYR